MMVGLEQQGCCPGGVERDTAEHRFGEIVPI